MESISQADIKWEEVSDGKLGILQSVVNSMNSGMIKFLKFKPGAVYPMHYHRDRFEWVYVVEGTIETDIGGGKKQMKKGDFHSFPVMVKHSLVAGKSGATVIVCALLCRSDAKLPETGII
ncbi:MAG: cupin domain-containing protein [Thermoplasmataceae archaeon]